MITKLDKIVVVGGGSAGWMSASFLKKAFPHRQIIVIESPNIPTIGVGESTLGGIKPFLRFLDIDEHEFMRGTDASYKMSIKFTNFYKNDGSSFHYPFGIPFEDSTISGISDWLVKKAVYPETPIADFVHCFFPASFLFEKNRFDLNHHGFYDNYNPANDVAYHFDAIKFAKYLREKYRKRVGIEYIVATVSDVITDDNGVKELVLDNGEKIEADLFVDCTGFRSLLIGEALKQEFVSFNNYLPNNRAWAAQIPYKNKEIELEAYTNCTAIQNGWVWNTPVWSRLGAGYVYSDKYVDPETAKEEFKHYILNQMLCKRSQEDLEQITFRDIPFRVGAYKKIFVKNVVAIGMSAGFLEPLESNGLYTIHEYLFKLAQILQRDVVTQFEKDIFNKQTYKMISGFAQFVSFHYVNSARSDTKYWLDNENRSIDLNEYVVSDIMTSMFDTKKFSSNMSGMNWISVGMNWIFQNKITLDNNRHEKFHGVFDLLEKRKIKWDQLSETAPRLIDYQRKYIYNEE